MVLFVSNMAFFRKDERLLVAAITRPLSFIPHPLCTLSYSISDIFKILSQSASGGHNSFYPPILAFPFEGRDKIVDRVDS